MGGSLSDEIKSICEASDGGYLAVGYTNSQYFDLGEGTDGEDIEVWTEEGYDGIIIKYNTERKSRFSTNSRRNR